MPLHRVTDMIHSVCVNVVSIMQRIHINELGTMNKVVCVWSDFMYCSEIYLDRWGKGTRTVSLSVSIVCRGQDTKTGSS